MAVISHADIVTAVQAALPAVQAITLFGSRAQGAETDASDLDLAVLLPGRADPVALWQAGETLAQRFGVDVDLVDLRAASTVMQFQIVSTGRRLFADGAEPDRYELYILAEMLALNEARAPLLADIQAEGRVHGR